jgi:hypothetical protein
MEADFTELQKWNLKRHTTLFADGKVKVGETVNGACLGRNFMLFFPA